MTANALGDPPVAETFKEAMSALAGGVCVVTTVDDQGTPHGFAATSVTSVSLDPPLILICQARTSRSHRVFAACESLAVNMLTADQRHLAERFAGRVADRFADAGFVTGDTGVPTCPAALATVECRLVETIDAGDHSILLGEVRSVRARPGTPLIYHGRRYQQVSPLP